MNYIHGKEDSKEYGVWEAMMGRCYQPNHISYRNYGAKGITVCERWHEAKNFLEDMGDRPTSEHTLDRVDSTKDYAPDNCRWATRTQQNRNRSATKLTMVAAREIRMLYNRGYTQCELAEEFAVTQATIWRVIHHKIWKENAE